MLLLFIASVAAHPVTFEGGTALYSVHRPRFTHIEVNHTIHRNVALAVNYRRMELDSSTLNVPQLQLNLLLKRWNLKGAQANIYAMVGGGADVSQLSNVDFGESLLGSASSQLDYETPSFYTAVSGFALFNEELSAYGARYRVGIAPYVADYNELQTWVIAQVDHVSDFADQPRITPMLRFFYRTVLWETGVSTNGHLWFQMMSHF